MIGGSLCSGSGGLDLGLERALAVEWAWHAEIDAAASKILAHHWPGTPNLGDFTAIDWAEVPRVELLAAGFPCPDYSLAGRRKGIDGDHGQVWYSVARAVRALRPAVLVLENVDGIRSAAGPVGGGPGDTALGVVLADLAEFGYRWAYDRVRAADVGAPHGRLRWFCVAALPSAADAFGAGVDADGRVRGRAAGALGPGGSAPSAVAAGPEVDGAADALEDGPGARPGRLALLPTPSASDATGAEGETRDRRREEGSTGGPSLRDLPKLLPTPTMSGTGNRDDKENRHLGHGPTLNDAAAEIAEIQPVRLLPTPTAGDGKSSGSRNLEGSKAHPGVSLTDAIQTGDSTTPRLLPTPTAEDGERGRAGAGSDKLGAATFDDEVRLLPTPQAADGDGGRQEKGAMANRGTRPSGQKATLPLPTAVEMREDLSGTPFAQAGDDDQLVLLPTPVANPENPGAGGELRAALVHGEGRRNESGTDTLGRPNRGRPPLLPTPNTRDHHAQGAGHDPAAHSSGLSTVVEKGKLLPTPTTQDGENTAGASQRERNSDPLNVVAADLGDPQLLPTPRAQMGATNQPSALESHEGGGRPRRLEVEIGRMEDEPAESDEPQLLPTPRVTSERNSRKAMVENQQWSSVSLAQATEIAAGVLPREFKSWDEVPGEIGRNARARMTADAPKIQWGVYGAAIARWEHVFGEQAPLPTDEKGRLAPDFVRWMLGYPPGWFDVAGLPRTKLLRCLGNSVQVQCGEAVGYWLAGLVRSGLLLKP